MMAKIKMANMTRSPICMSGAKALKMDLRTTWRPRKSFKISISIITISNLTK
jgi:hypothetical protein